MKLMKYTVILMVPLLLLTGCWDEIEIEERAFISGVAVDLAEESTTNSRIEMTSQFVVPSKLITPSGGGGGGSGQAYSNLSHTGEALQDTSREMLKETSRQLDVTHLEIVLFSEDLARQKDLFKEMIDVFLREKDMRRGILIAITSGKAKEFLTVAPEHESIPSEYIRKLVEIKGNLEIIKTIRIGDIQEKILQRESFALPLLELNKPKRVNYDGVALFNGQDNEMVGMLTGDDSKGLSFLIDDRHTGTLNIDIEGKVSTVDILNIKNRVSLENDDPRNLRFLFTIDITGTIAEQIGNQDVMDPKVHEIFEQELVKEVEKVAYRTLEKLQKDYQTDVLGLGVYLKNFHPKIWREVKENWEKGENYFTNSQISLKINPNIQRPGSMNKTSDGRID